MDNQDQSIDCIIHDHNAPQTSDSDVRSVGSKLRVLLERSSETLISRSLTEETHRMGAVLAEETG